MVHVLGYPVFPGDHRGLEGARSDSYTCAGFRAAQGVGLCRHLLQCQRGSSNVAEIGHVVQDLASAWALSSEGETRPEGGSRSRERHRCFLDPPKYAISQREIQTSSLLLDAPSLGNNSHREKADCISGQPTSAPTLTCVRVQPNMRRHECFPENDRPDHFALSH